MRNLHFCVMAALMAAGSKVVQRMMVSAQRTGQPPPQCALKRYYYDTLVEFKCEVKFRTGKLTVPRSGQCRVPLAGFTTWSLPGKTPAKLRATSSKYFTIYTSRLALNKILV